MDITLRDEKGRELQTARPKGGMASERELMLSILTNLMIGMAQGKQSSIMEINTTGANMEQLKAIAMALRRC